MTDYTAYFKGELMPYSQVRIDPTDRGFLLGDVVFDTGRTFDGKLFRLKHHIDRLYRPLKYASIDPGLSPGEMTEVTEEALHQNEGLRGEVGDFTFPQFVTRGKGGVTIAGRANRLR